MKYLLYLLICLPLTSFSQLRQANLIVIPTNGSVETIYKKAVVALVQNGFIIEESAKDLRSLRTGPKVLSEEEITITINLDLFIVSGKEIQLRGNTFIPNVGTSNIENVGMRGSPAQAAWHEMNRIAKQLGGEIMYKISYRPPSQESNVSQ